MIRRLASTAEHSYRNRPLLRCSLWGWALWALASTPLAEAAKYSNAFTAFELPAGWTCNQEGAEFVCQNTNELKKKDTIIVLAAKTATPQDTLDAYRLYLKSPKTWTGPQGKSVKSEPRSDKTVNVGGTMWIDALHMESEIPGFYTRYLATVKHDIGVLVTLSVASAKYKEYLTDFDAIAQSIQVFKKAEAAPVAAAPTGGGTLSGPNITLLPDNSAPTGVFQAPATPAEAPAKKGPRNASGDGLMLLLIIGGAVVALILIKKKKQG